MLEHALRSKYNIQSSGKNTRMILDSALFVSGSKTGRGIGRSGGCAGSNKGKLDSRGRSERLSPQAK